MADTFNRYFEPENLRAAVKVLAAAGYRAVMPGTRGRPLCCGRTWLAVGMVDKARGEADRTMHFLPGDLPIIGLEPSCLMTLRDEFRSLRPGAATDAFAARSMLLERIHRAGKARSGPEPAAGDRPGSRALPSEGVRGVPRRAGDASADPETVGPADRRVMLRDGGHVRLPGGTQTTSRAMAEAGLLPAIRAAAAHDYIVADGTSCRHQIRDLSGREAVHSVRLMERALEG